LLHGFRQDGLNELAVINKNRKIDFLVSFFRDQNAFSHGTHGIAKESCSEEQNFCGRDHRFRPAGSFQRKQAMFPCRILAFICRTIQALLIVFLQ
jgi:hypothetical protein